MNFLDNQNLANWIIFSLNKLFENDSILLENNVHEQSFSNKIACYLTSNMSNYLDKNKLNIDCEYNKAWKDLKEFKNIISEFIWWEYIVKDKKGKKNIVIYRKWKIIYSIKKYCLCSIKELNNESHKLIIWKIKWDEIIIETQSIRPDIIIHERLYDNNLCVFEIKKWILSEKDILKLKWFTYKNLNFWYDYWIWLSEFDITKKTVKIDIFIDWENKYSEVFSLNQNKDISLDESLNEALEWEFYTIDF